MAEATATATVPQADLRSEEMLLNIGPQHPSTHGVLRVVVRTDGEMILDSELHVGYLHRCFEKCAEVSGGWAAVVPYTDRLDYLAAMQNNFGYCLAVEKLMKASQPDFEVPERAEYIRVIVAELQRIASHLLAVGTFGMDSGAITPFLLAFRDREYLLKMFEKICGQRLNYSYVKIGGVGWDLDDDMIEDIKWFCDYFESKVHELNNLLSYNGIFIRRTADVGTIDPTEAIRWGITGPVLRGCGIKRDLRKDQPYGIYDRFEFDVPVGTAEHGSLGDSWNRYMVRVWEMIESLKIVKQAVYQLPEGPHIAKMRAAPRPKAGDAYVKVENARGELGFYIVSDGSDKPYRVKVRSPCFINLQPLPEFTRGTMVADMVIIIGSLDIVMGEIDR